MFRYSSKVAGSCRWLVLLVLSAAAAFAAEEGRRVALIIGNDAYSIKPLQNAINDARAINKALMGAGFRTIVRENANKVAMEQGAAEFLQAIGPGDTALFYYSGHAVQIENENVLIPVDYESSRTIIEARFRSFSLAMIFDYLKRSRAKTTIVIIDACRSNPVAEGHALQAGLAIPANAGRETYIAFSTSPNHVASDNPDGKNSWFTEALGDLITQDALTLDEIFTRVRMRVEKATRGSQTPWSQTSLTNKFYFHPPKDALAANDPTIIEQWLQDSAVREQFGDWEEALEILNRIVKQQPGGQLEEAAKARLPYVKARLDASTQFEAGKFSNAAQSFEEALRMDPFAFDAVEGAFRSRLIDEDMDKAIAALQVLRQRGTSAASAKAELVLKELAAVSPKAAEELKRGVPQPPPAQELFTGRRFGVPDWSAGHRLLRQSRPADLAKWVKQLPEPPPPRVVAPAGESASSETKLAMSEVPVTLESFHVQIKSISGTRDLVREEFGELQLKSEQANTTVLLDGKPITSQLPYKMRIPAGKYVINTVDRGQVLGTREVEVPPGALVELSFK